MKHRCGDVSRETSQGRASLRGGELKERRFRAEIIYFLVCCHFLFFVCRERFCTLEAMRPGNGACCRHGPEGRSLRARWTLGDVSRPGGRSHADACCPYAVSEEADQRLTPCGRCGSLSRSKSRGMPDAHDLNRSRRPGPAERARPPSDGGLWLRRRPEQARPDAVRRSPKKGGHPAMSALNVHPEKVGRGAYRPACAGRRCPGISAP